MTTLPITPTAEEAAEHKVARSLRNDVRQALGMPFTPAWQKEDLIFPALGQGLGRVGHFYRTEQGEAVYFRNRDRRIYELTDKSDVDEFGRLVTYLADLSVRNVMVRRCIDRLRAKVVQEAPTIKLHALAYNGPDLDTIAINDFGGGMWYRNRGGAWVWKPNGHAGIYFWTPGRSVDPWKPEFTDDHRTDEEHLQWLIEQAHFAEEILTVGDQRMLFRALLLAQFFPSMCRVRPVHAHLGLSQKRQHDTGKTMAGKMIGVVFVGPRFEPTPKPESTEKDQEALRLELMHKPFVLLDNVDTDVKWLNDWLATYTTGNLPTKRRLYTDTEQVEMPVRGRLVITSRRATFKRPDVASRAVPFRFEPIAPEERKTESQLLEPVTARRGQIWAGILAVIGRVQDAYPNLSPPAPQIRLADFEQFGWVVSAVHGEADKWQTMVPRLSAAQAGFALEGEALVPVLKKRLEAGDMAEQKTSAFYELVRETAGDLELDMEIPFSAAALTERIGELQEGLEAVLDIRIKMRTLQGYRLIQIARGPSWQKGAVGISEVSEVRRESPSSAVVNQGDANIGNNPNTCPPVSPPFREAKPTPPTGESIAKLWPGLGD